MNTLDSDGAGTGLLGHMQSTHGAICDHLLKRELKTPAGGRRCAVHSCAAADPYFIFLIGFYAVGCFIHPLTYYVNFSSKGLDYRFTDYFDNEIQLFNIVN